MGPSRTWQRDERPSARPRALSPGSGLEIWAVEVKAFHPFSTKEDKQIFDMRDISGAGLLA